MQELNIETGLAAIEESRLNIQKGFLELDKSKFKVLLEASIEANDDKSNLVYSMEIATIDLKIKCLEICIEKFEEIIKL